MEHIGEPSSQVPRPLHGSHPARRHTKVLTSVVAKSEVMQEVCVAHWHKLKLVGFLYHPIEKICSSKNGNHFFARDRGEKKNLRCHIGGPLAIINWALQPLEMATLHGINISHLGKRKIIFKMPFLGDMLVPWRVTPTWCFNTRATISYPQPSESPSIAPSCRLTFGGSL